MLKLISLFFHLGLHIGSLNKLVPTNMYQYLLGHRFSRNIYNIRLSILYIRKVTLFLLVAGKLNYSVLPVLHGFNLPATGKNNISNYADYKLTPYNKKAILRKMSRSIHTRKFAYLLNVYRRYKKFIVLYRKLKPSKLRKRHCILVNYRFKKYNIRHLVKIRKALVKIRKVLVKIRKALNKKQLSRLLIYLSNRRSFGAKVHTINYFGNDAIANLFYNYRFPVLLNTIGLINNWGTYYNTLRNVFSEIIPKYINTRKLNIAFVKKLGANMQSNFLYNCTALVMCIYYKLNLNIELNIISYRFKINHLVSEFKKFYVFIKFLVYLREYIQFPSVLFYLDPSESELATISKYRICTIALVSSHLATSNYVTYPIPSNFGTYLSKFFYASLFVNAHFIGRILLVLNSIS